MLDKCGEGTCNIYRKQFESALVPNAFSVAYACDERDERESHPGGETSTCSSPELNILCN